MTHTLHRQGTPESLSDDYVVFAIAAQGINSADAAPKLRRFLELAQQFNPVNIGDMKTGNMFTAGVERILAGIKENSIVHAVFTSEERVVELLRALKAEDLGISIVVSGLLHNTASCCRQAGLTPHTVEHSLGIWGRTELLPDSRVLEITTMCGHGMVAFDLVTALVDDIRSHRTTAEKAAREITSQCHCGVMNPVRVKRLLEALALPEAAAARDN